MADSITLADQGVTARQEAFVSAILSNMGQAEAYRHAGYAARNDNVASVSSSKLLSNPKISTAIARLKSGTAERVDVSQDKLVAEYWDTYHASRQQETPNLTAARQCLDSLARITGLFDSHSVVDVQHSGTVNHLQSVSLEKLEELLEAIDSTVTLSIEAPDSEDSDA